MNKLVKKILIFLEMIKFEHSIFALPFAYLGLFLAEGGFPSFSLFIWITLAMVTFRSMAMGANRLLDAEIDAKNPRTAERAIPTGKLSKKSVWVITLIFFILFELVCLRLNPICFQLSPLIVALAWLYPLLKRLTWLCHFVLGFILSVAPYGAWLASQGTFSWIPAWFMIGITCWVAGFDIIYALQDHEFDEKQGLHSFPSRFGKEKSLQMTTLLHIIAIISWAIAGSLSSLSWIYGIGLFFSALFLVREHWLIRRFDLAKIQEAFFTMNAFISVGLFICVVLDLIILGG